MPDVEIIRLPNTLATRIGPRVRVFTAILVKRAEAALERISVRFEGWLQEDIRHLEEARANYYGDASPLALKALAKAARQLESSGASLGRPLISRLAASLGRLLAHETVPPRLLDAHIDAIRAAGRMSSGDDSAISAETCLELESRVDQITRSDLR